MARKDDPRQPVTCRNCGGSGTVIVYENRKPKAVTCGVCHGAGVV